MTDVLFVGKGRSVVSWYRCALPALFGGHDWVGMSETGWFFTTGIVRKPWTGRDSLFQYDIVVWQQPTTAEHHQTIKEMRAKGIKVLIEVDDYLHGVRRMKDHDFRDAKPFSKKELLKFERIMSQVDGVICSTDYLRSKYSRFAQQSWTCLNGLDLGRYYKSRSEHQTVNIGWSGATGHVMSFGYIRRLVDEALRKRDDTTFISIGQPFAEEWAADFGQQQFPRILALPFSSIEVYPNAISMFDIALAPARDTGWYRAKSALRFYESAALGIPTIGSPLIYGEINHGVDGFLAETEEEWREALWALLDDEELRAQIGHNAYERAEREFDMEVRKEQWTKVFAEVMA